MTDTLMIIIYVFLLFFMIRLLIKNNKIRTVNLYSGFLFGIILYYIIVPIGLLINKDKMSEKYLDLQKYIYSNDMSIILPIILIIITVIFFTVGYKVAYGKEKKVYQLSKKVNLNSIKFISHFSFLVGAISFSLVISGFGSLANALKYAELNRSFSVSLADLIDYRLSLLFIPSRLITVAPFLYFYQLKNTKKLSPRILFLISFIISIFYLLFNAGKGPLLAFLLPFFYIFLKKYKKNAWRYLITLSLLFFPLLELLDRLFMFLANGIWKDEGINFFNIFYQFIHPYRNIFNVENITTEFGYRFFTDFITGPLNLMPGIDFEKSYEITSKFYFGDIWKSVGGVPNDLITFGYIQMNFLGVIILSLFIGYFFGLIDKKIRCLNPGIAKDLITSLLIVSAFRLIPNADIEPFLRSNFTMILIPFALIWYSKKNRLNRRCEVENIVYNK